MNIWLAEDSLFMQVIIQGIIEKHFDLEMKVFADGKQLWDAFQVKQSFEVVDLIITDLTMPVMDGVTLTSHIRKMDRQVPIVWCTSMPTKELIVNAIRTKSIQHCIKKPFDQEEFAEIIKPFLVSIDRSPQGRILNLEPFLFFHYVRQNEVGIVKDFVHSGMDVNVRLKGKTVVDTCVNAGSTDVFEFFLEKMDMFNLDNIHSLKKARLKLLIQSQ